MVHRGSVIPVAEGGGGGNADGGDGEDAGDGLGGEVGQGRDELAAASPEDGSAEKEEGDVGADGGGEAEAGGTGERGNAVGEEFCLEGEQGGGGVGGAGTEAALDGEAFFDVDADVGCAAELLEGEMNGAPGGVAVVERDAGVVGGEADAGGGGGSGGDGDEVVEGEGLVEGGEVVEAVGAGWADGEAEVDFGRGAEGGRHRALL